MFLKQVYKHSKWMFAVIVIFIAAQSVINYNHGAVFSPFYNYGMYSEVFTVKDNYDVVLVEVNGKILRGEDFTIQHWDKIYLPIHYFLAADSNNTAIIDIRNRMYSKLGLSSLKQRNNAFVNPPVTASEYMTWYSSNLQKILHYPVKSIIIKKAAYNISGDKTLSATHDDAKLILPPWNLATSTNIK